ncbi:MAG: AAA family ATPase [Deltaproteobacteria bacterium]|nr:AAA family ATPase [Deltaproteobacteria bacterium]
MQEPDQATIREVRRALIRLARPRAEHACWIDPGKDASEPAVLLLGRRTGLLVVLARAWTSTELISATPGAFLLSKGEGRLKRPNPDRAGRRRPAEVREALKEAGVDPGVPVAHATAFPGMTRARFVERGFHWFVPGERVLFRDDLAPGGDLDRDATGAGFRRQVSMAFPRRSAAIGARDMDRVLLALHPEALIRGSEGEGAGRVRFQEGVAALDEAQARAALRLSSGHQVITGPPGSGKTQVLVHRCAFLSRYGSGFRRILLVCYNIALVGYLESLVRERGLAPSDDGVLVTHFYELCGRILGDTVPFENRDHAFYRDVTLRTLERVREETSPGVDRFDAVLVDEAQDFSDDMLRVVTEMLRPGGDLVVALDASQDLYGRRSAWESLGVRARGRTRRLEHVYRNTAEIFEFGRRFLGRQAVRRRQPAVLPEPWPFQGPLPQLRRFESMDAVLSFVAGEIRARVETEGRSGETAVIYDDKIYGRDRFSYDNRAMPMRILGALEQAGVGARWVSRDARPKRAFEPGREPVVLISIHSAKGLDFDRVYLVGVDRIVPPEAATKKVQATLYVALTRARYALVVPYVEETPFIHRMRVVLQATRKGAS